MLLVELDRFLSDLNVFSQFEKIHAKLLHHFSLIFLFHHKFCGVVFSTLCIEMLYNKSYGKPRLRQAKILCSMQEEFDLLHQYI